MSAADRVAMQARFGVPDNEVPASVPFAAVLARTAQVAVSVVNLQVHSAGLVFTVAARMRQPPDRSERHGGRGVFGAAGVEPDGVLSADFLRIAVVFADDRVATNLAGHRYLRSGGPIPPDQPILAQGHGSSGERRADAT